MCEHKPGPEFDALIIKKVLGWKVIGCCGEQQIWENENEKTVWTGPFCPSTDITTAWEVVEKLIEMRQYCRLQWTHGNGVWACSVGTGWLEADTASMAICLAALRAAEAKGT